MDLNGPCASCRSNGNNLVLSIMATCKVHFLPPALFLLISYYNIIRSCFFPYFLQLNFNLVFNLNTAWNSPPPGMIAALQNACHFHIVSHGSWAHPCLRTGCLPVPTFNFESAMTGKQETSKHKCLFPSKVSYQSGKSTCYLFLPYFIGWKFGLQKCLGVNKLVSSFCSALGWVFGQVSQV